MQDSERKIAIHFLVKGSRSQTELGQHFGFDTLIWVVFNLELSYLYIDAEWWEEDSLQNTFSSCRENLENASANIK